MKYAEVSLSHVIKLHSHKVGDQLYVQSFVQISSLHVPVLDSHTLQYAIGLSRSLFRKGISPKMIEHRLKQKGLEQDIIDEALGEILPDNANMLAALQLLKRRRYGIFATHPDKKEEQKILGLLARSGFSYQTASRVMAIDMDEALDLLDTL